MYNRENFLKHVIDTPSPIGEKIEYWRKNRFWLSSSVEIALIILDKLEENDMTKKQLSILSGISLNVINKMVKGQYNFTLKQIKLLEKALNYKFITIDMV